MQIRGTWSAGPGDNQERFLADLRALRDSAAIGYDELAARAHFPSDVLKEAENGPSLPGLPILTAYVRACEGDVLDWEERWRRLNPDAADDPNLPVRPAGASEAAVAGARAGVGVAPPDVYDPERIRAALRGGRTRSDRASRRTGDPGITAPGASGAARSDGSGIGLDNGGGWGTGTAWDAGTGPAVTTANGHHAGERVSRGPFDAAFPSHPDSAEPAPTEEFSWLKKSTPEPRPIRSPGSLDSEPTWPEAAPAPDLAVTERIPLYQADSPASAEPGDFWTKPAALAAAGQLAAAQAPTEPAIPRAVWPAPGDTAAAAALAAAVASPAVAASPGAAAEAAHQATAALSPAGPAQATADGRNGHRQDRLFPVRLLVVVIIAALVGSVLVLLLK